MIIMRPAIEKDVQDILDLSLFTGGGLTTLPNDEQTIANRVMRSLRTWSKELPLSEQGYLFVMEDTSLNKVVGVCAIEVAVGLSEPWYSYRVTKEVHASKALNVYQTLSTLVLSNDHTGYSELCTLFLSPNYRKGALGRLLSKSRLLFIAANRELFPDVIIAELRGFRDENNQSPFWENIGKHFFSMEFDDVDFLSGTGQKAFIAELMPKHPLYVDLMPQQVKNCIGEVHLQTIPARKMLEREGLRFQNHIDIFDGGPALEAQIDEVKTIKESQLMVWDIDETISLYDHENSEAEFDKIHSTILCLVANEQIEVELYKVTVCFAKILENRLYLHPAVIKALHLKSGHLVRMKQLS
ncbi:arginine N-succinyltransferase [Thorsellia kenyensis]|uniref:Arginine N-succinyltransferase n=1 Tax=Thorsellia kenyensis TaxID=1549888 RepID=A0ABV6CBD0_9GAMM